MSDTHNQLKDIKFEIPDGDVFVFTGDISGNSLEEKNVKDFNIFLNRLPHKHKVVIAGNHDFIFEKKKGSELLIGNGIHYLEDSSITIDDVKFYGTPFQPDFYSWAFNLKNPMDLKHKWSLIPSDTNVLLTHNAPYKILDKTKYGIDTGCNYLSHRITELSDLKAHCFGHIHESYGMVTINNVIYANSCNCNLNYKPVNPPLVFDI